MGAILRQALPLKVLAVLHGRRKPVGGALTLGGVELAQLAQQNTYGPAIQNQMMSSHEQDVTGVRQFENLGA